MSTSVIEAELLRISRLGGEELRTGIQRWCELLDGYGPTVGDLLASLLESRTNAIEIELIVTGLPDHPSPMARTRLEALLLGEPWVVGPEDIVEALEAIGSRDAVPALVRALQHRAPAPQPSLRKKIACALGVLGGADAIASLRELARDEDPDVAEVAKTALETAEP